MNSSAFTFSDSLSRAQAGDERAMEALFDEAAPSILYYCEVRLGKRLRQHCEPADVAQETFIQAWGSIAQFSGDGGWTGFLRWLYRVAENRIRAIHQYVSAGKRQPPGPKVEDSHFFDQLRNSLTGPLSAAARSEQQEQLRRSLSELPEEERCAVVLYYFHNASVVEIAEDLDKPETSTRRLLARALQGLSRDLGGE